MAATSQVSDFELLKRAGASLETRRIPDTIVHCRLHPHNAFRDMARMHNNVAEAYRQQLARSRRDTTV